MVAFNATLEVKLMLSKNLLIELSCYINNALKNNDCDSTSIAHHSLHSDNLCNDIINF